MTTAWIKAAGVRALRTAAQTAVALIGTGAAGLLDVDWVGVASGSALAAVLSLLTSLGGLPELDGDAPEWDDEPGSDDLRGERG